MKKILVVTSHFDNNYSAAANHAKDRIKQLLLNGYVVKIITEISGNVSIIEDVFLNDRKALSFSLTGRTAPVSKIQKIFKHRRILSKHKMSAWHLEKEYKREIAKCLGEYSPDLVYTTGSAVTHLAMSGIKVLNRGKWIAELQDPLVFDEMTEYPYQVSEDEKNLLINAEDRIGNADMILCLTQSCSEQYRLKIPLVPVCCARPPIDQDTLDGEHALSFYHGGTLSKDRNLDLFFEAVKCSGLMESVKIVLTGHVDQGLLSRYSKERVKYLGLLSREVSKEISRGQDVLLVIQNKNPISALTIPSKLYEYVAMRKPIFFLGYKNEEVRKLAVEWNFYYADQSIPREIISVLRDLLDNERKKQPFSDLHEKADAEFRALLASVFND